MGSDFVTFWELVTGGSGALWELVIPSGIPGGRLIMGQLNDFGGCC